MVVCVSTTATSTSKEMKDKSPSLTNLPNVLVFKILAFLVRKDRTRLMKCSCRTLCLLTDTIAYKQMDVSLCLSPAALRAFHPSFPIVGDDRVNSGEQVLHEEVIEPRYLPNRHVPCVTTLSSPTPSTLLINAEGQAHLFDFTRHQGIARLLCRTFGFVQLPHIQQNTTLDSSAVFQKFRMADRTTLAIEPTQDTFTIWGAEHGYRAYTDQALKMYEMRDRNRNIYITFELDSYLKDAPLSEEEFRAGLFLYKTWDGRAHGWRNNNDHYLVEMVQPWDESTLTALNQPPHLDGAPPNTSVYIGPRLQEFYEIDVTSYVRHALGNGLGRVDLMLSGNSPGSLSAFSARENREPNQRPFLFLTVDIA